MSRLSSRYQRARDQASAGGTSKSYGSASPGSRMLSPDHPKSGPKPVSLIGRAVSPYASINFAFHIDNLSSFQSEAYAW
jgi:hypothetical protein